MSPPPIQPTRLPSLADAPQVVPYQGSKRGLAHAILPLLPPDTATLIEPFAGSAAVAVSARHVGAARSVHIRDINAPLIALWDRILNEPIELADDYERLWNAQLGDPRGYYEKVRAEFNKTREPHLLLYLLNRCVKAAVRYNKIGEFNQSADHRRLGARPSITRARITQTSGLMRGAAVTAGDYEGVLLGAMSDDVVYMDPPYQGVSNTRDHRYMSGLNRRRFESSLHVAIERGVSFIVSYDVVTDSNIYGEQLSAGLGLVHLHVIAGRSSQATLQGRRRVTVESLYLSPALVDRLGGASSARSRVEMGPPQAASAGSLF